MATRVTLPSTINGCDSSGPTAERPKSPDAGQPYWDTDTGSLFVFDDGEWVEYAPVAKQPASKPKK